MAIVEMKRIDLLAMRQDQKKLLRAMQRMGCVEVTPISGENLEAYQKQDVTRLPQVETTMERLRWTIGQLSQYNRQKPPFLGSLRTLGTCSISSSMRQNSWHCWIRQRSWKRPAATCADSWPASRWPRNSWSPGRGWTSRWRTSSAPEAYSSR